MLSVAQTEWVGRINVVRNGQRERRLAAFLVTTRALSTLHNRRGVLSFIERDGQLENRWLRCVANGRAERFDNMDSLK